MLSHTPAKVVVIDINYGSGDIYSLSRDLVKLRDQKVE